MQWFVPVSMMRLHALHHEMMACFSRRNVSGYYEANAKIHNAINLAAKNPLLTTMYRSVNGRAQLMRFNSNYDERKWKRAVSEHEQTLEALASLSAGGLNKFTCRNSLPVDDRLR
jgi:DNA-binding GntR family transcriptional regulator